MNPSCAGFEDQGFRSGYGIYLCTSIVQPVPLTMSMFIAVQVLVGFACLLINPSPSAPIYLSKYESQCFLLRKILVGMQK